MKTYRKNIAGFWKIATISKEEVKDIQTKTIKYGLAKYMEIKQLAEANKLELSDSAIATILAKVAPSYESLVNDYIEEKLADPKSE